MAHYIVYVIESIEGYRYIGVTEDIEQRLKEHNEHQLSFWTKRGTDWKLLYSEEYEAKTEALKREQWLKSGVGREFLNKMINI